MQARITRFKMRQDSVAAAQALMHELRTEIMALPGVKRMVIVMNGDGSGHTIALVDEAGASAAAVDRVRGVWHKFHDHLERVPDPEIYAVIADWGG